MQSRVRRRYITTADSDHDSPIFPNLARDILSDGPDQLWVADLTYVAVTDGFVYVAIILDAWSRRMVGFALGRSIDARLTILSFLQHLPCGIDPDDGPCGLSFGQRSQFQALVRAEHQNPRIARRTFGEQDGGHSMHRLVARNEAARALGMLGSGLRIVEGHD